RGPLAVGRLAASRAPARRGHRGHAPRGPGHLLFARVGRRPPSDRHALRALLRGTGALPPRTQPQPQEIRMTARTELKPLTPAEAKALVDSGKAILVDIRETDEHARENIAGATLTPLSRIAAGEAESAAKGKLVIFHCQSGMRTSTNA